MVQDMGDKQHESPLVSAFRDRDRKSDIVGLARIPTDDATFLLSLRTLDAIVTNKVPAGWDADKTLAKVLVAMTMVALNYGDEGHGYWHGLSETIKEKTGHWTELATNSHLQALLGDSFRRALQVFGYSAPAEVGHPYVGTILFHAGIPRPALRQVLPVVIDACKRHKSEAVSLGRELRRPLFEDRNRRMQESVRRLFCSDFVGADELWACLVRVVRAWRTKPTCRVELGQLPTPALDPARIQEILDSYDSHLVIFRKR